MHYILSSCSREILAHFAASRIICAFDFDGTLAPIVSDPEHACMRRTTHLLLSKLSEIRTCLVVSGRSQEDLGRKLAGVSVEELIGNHGAEPWAGAEQVRQHVRQWERVVRAELQDLPGLWIENKGLSLTIHYRQCRWKSAARSAVARSVRSLQGVRLVGGKQAVSIVSREAPHKGMALKSALVRLQGERALYVGDDETDEDVFADTGAELSLLTIRVGRKNSSRASYFLRNQSEMDDLLRFLIRISSNS